MNPIFFFNREITPVRKLLMLHAVAGGGAGTEYTETGNPLTFLTDLARPLKSCLATWQPHQSGSGDPSPSNVRPVVGMDGVNVWHGGKNLLPNDEVKAEGNQFFLCASSSNYPFYLVPGKYTLSTTGKTAFAYYKKHGGSGVLIHGNAVNYGTFTITDGGNYQIWYYTSGATAEDFTDVQLEVGESATTYEAPQVGTSYSVAFPATGKNQWNEEWEVGWYNTSTGLPISTSTNQIRSKSTSPIPVEPNTQYYVYSGANINLRCLFYDEEDNFLSSPSGLQNTTVTSPPNAKYMRFHTGGGYGETYNNNIAINYPATATFYEPYTATVYGGTLDLTTGVLTAEWAVINSANVGWQTSSYQSVFSCTPTPEKKNGADNFIIDKYKVVDKRFADLADYESRGNAANKNIYIRNSTFTSASEVGASDFNMCYELETPITYQLTPQQITALIGNNTMWADADDLSVTYLKKG